MPRKKLFYISFASDKFLGACVVRATSESAAEKRADELGIKPGGEAMAWEIAAEDEHRIPMDLRDRLLTEKEVRERLSGIGVGE